MLVKHLSVSPLTPDSIINVNIPDLPFASFEVFRRSDWDTGTKQSQWSGDTDPRGRTIYWVGPAGVEQDAGPGTDFMRCGRVSYR